MISRIDHISIAVSENSYDKAINFFTKVFGAIPGAGADDDNLKYHWQILSMGDLTRVEIITPTGEGSFLDNFLKKRDAGPHHITLQTPDIKMARQLLEKHGVPFFGYSEIGSIWKELFIHPKDAFGILIQIAEFNAEDYLAPSVNMPEETKYRVQKSDSGCSLSFAHPGGGKVKIILSKEEIVNLVNDLEKVI